MALALGFRGDWIIDVFCKDIAQQAAQQGEGYYCFFHLCHFTYYFIAARS